MPPYPLTPGNSSGGDSRQRLMPPLGCPGEPELVWPVDAAEWLAHGGNLAQHQLNRTGAKALIQSPVIIKFGVQQLDARDSRGIKPGHDAQRQALHGLGSHRGHQLFEVDRDSRHTIGSRCEFVHPAQASRDQVGETADAITAGQCQLETPALASDVQFETAAVGEVQRW